MMKEDYEIYGGVMVFDTTYITNRFEELKSNNTFNNIFYKCLSGCSNEEEFENCWRSMIIEYKLENNNWFTRFESTNHAIGLSADQYTSLTDFYGIFKNTIKRWRRVKQQYEFNCSRARPDSYFEIAGRVSHASDVYTLSLFTKFQKEFMKGISASSTIIGQHDTTIIYTVTSSKEECSSQVIFDSSLNLITCSCMKFENSSHQFRSKNTKGLHKKRRTKMGKLEVWDKFGKEKSNTEKLREFHTMET
ncbi:hypothetical protein ACS0TY_033890 [Phlomoides rotata]